MNIINKVKVTICGKEYKLQTDESPEYIIGLAARLDKDIKDLIKLKPNFGVQNAAVFAALTSLDEAKKANDSIDNIRGQIKAYVDDAAKARVASTKAMVELREAKSRIQELEKANRDLEKEIKELEKKLSAYDCEQLVLENTISSAVTIYAEPAENKEESAEEEGKPENNEPKAEDVSNGSEKKSDEKGTAEESKSVGSKPTDGKAANDGNAPLSDDVKEAAAETEQAEQAKQAEQNKSKNTKSNGRGRKKKR